MHHPLLPAVLPSSNVGDEEVADGGVNPPSPAADAEAHGDGSAGTDAHASDTAEIPIPPSPRPLTEPTSPYDDQDQPPPSPIVNSPTEPFRLATPSPIHVSEETSVEPRTIPNVTNLGESYCFNAQ